MNFLFTKRVDLILQAHDHEYQRFKQLTCATVNAYNASCVANDGSTDEYTKGDGSIIVISGDTGGGEFGSINTTDPGRHSP